MPGRKTGFAFMFAFVEDYLSGEADRLTFDLDFNHYLMEHYPRMERKNAELAECFVFYLAEQGHDVAQGLSDAAHKKLIRKQYNEFVAAMNDGLL